MSSIGISRWTSKRPRFPIQKYDNDKSVENDSFVIVTHHHIHPLELNWDPISNGSKPERFFGKTRYYVVLGILEHVK